MIEVVIEDSITDVLWLVKDNFDRGFHVENIFRRIKIVALFWALKFIFDESKLDFDSTVSFGPSIAMIF
jgi:hypothetical protein